MTYKILIPVTTRPDLVKDKISKLPNENLILINNFNEKKVLDLCLQAKDQGSEVYSCPENYGIGASWNLGLKKVLEDKDDFIFLLSVSSEIKVEFDRIVDLVREAEIVKPRSIYYFANKVGRHFFVHTKRSIQLGGFYDENYYPAYHEDTDYNYRSRFNGIDREVFSFNRSDLIGTYGYGLSKQESTSLFKYICSFQTFHNEYYARKWGGLGLDASYKTPYNDSSLDINFWEMENPNIPQTILEKL